MRTRYYCLAAGATVFGGALLILQIVGGLEWTADASPYTRASMVLTMITVAALPVFLDLAWRISWIPAALLTVGFALFLAYSLPATIGRIGEVKEVKVVVQGDAAELRSRLADLDRTLKYARPDMESECIGAPEPLPIGRWKECRRKRGSVAAFEAERRRVQADIDALGGATARLGDTSSQMLAWALAPLGGIKEETIRKGSSLSFAVGLEIVIAAFFALASVALRRAARIGAVAAISAVPPPQPGTRVTPASAPPKGSAPVAPEPAPLPANVIRFSRDEALADVNVLIKAGQSIASQDFLAERWGRRKSTVSRWMKRWAADGDLCGERRVEGRRKVLVAA